MSLEPLPTTLEEAFQRMADVFRPVADSFLGAFQIYLSGMTVKELNEHRNGWCLWVRPECDPINVIYLYSTQGMAVIRNPATLRTCLVPHHQLIAAFNGIRTLN